MTSTTNWFTKNKASLTINIIFRWLKYPRGKSELLIYMDWERSFLIIRKMIHVSFNLIFKKFCFLIHFIFCLLELIEMVPETNCCSEKVSQEWEGLKKTNKGINSLILWTQAPTPVKMKHCNDIIGTDISHDPKIF